MRQVDPQLEWIMSVRMRKPWHQWVEQLFSDESVEAQVWVQNSRSRDQMEVSQAPSAKAKATMLLVRPAARKGGGFTTSLVDSWRVPDTADKLQAMFCGREDSRRFSKNFGGFSENSLDKLQISFRQVFDEVLTKLRYFS